MDTWWCPVRGLHIPKTFCGLIRLFTLFLGLPTRNTDHAEQIASVALEMLQLCQHFTIDHMPSIPLQIRIGMHTGIHLLVHLFTNF